MWMLSPEELSEVQASIDLEKVLDTYVFIASTVYEIIIIKGQVSSYVWRREKGVIINFPVKAFKTKQPNPVYGAFDPDSNKSTMNRYFRASQWNFNMDWILEDN